MAFNLGLETFNTTVIDDDNADLETLLFATAESMQNLADSEARMLNCVATMENIDEAMANMAELQNVISEEGISAGLLMLFNKDNELASAIGREIPELTTDNIKEVSTICEEGLMDSLKSGYKKVKEFFQKILKWVTDFIAGLLDASKRQLSTCGKIKADLPDWIKKADDKAFSKKEAKVFSKTDFDRFVVATGTLTKLIGKVSITKIELKDYSGILSTFGYEVKDDKLKKTKDGFGPEKKDTFDKLGWKLDDLVTHLDATMDMLKDAQTVKTTQAKFKGDIAEAIKILDGLERAGDDKDAKAAEQKKVDLMKKNAVILTQLVSIYGKSSKTIANTIITICGKVKGSKEETKKDDK